MSKTLTLPPQGVGRDRPRVGEGGEPTSRQPPRAKDAEASTLTLYTRAGCPLCEDMAEHVRTLIAGTRHRLVPVDVDADSSLKAAFGWEVPLLFDGDAEICRHQLNLPAFQEWLRAHP